MAFLQSLFVDKAIVDSRESIFSFSIPNVEGTFGIFAPEITAWKQLAILMLIQAAIQCTFGLVIYKFIVQRRGTTASYLLGWGFILPVSMYIPFWLLEFLDLRNRVITLSASTVQTVVFFRCLEAMYNTSHEVVETSLFNYLCYYSSVAPLVWDSKTKAPKNITGSELLFATLEICVYFAAASVILSFLMHFNYKPFDSPVQLNQLEWSLDILSPAHIGNAYLHAVLLYCTLKTGFDLTAFGENLKGFATQPIFDSPFMATKSPTDFWTKRWNLMIQRILKGGVFLPAQKFFPVKVAVFLTFAASGLFHDYVWSCMFYNQKELYGENGVCDGCYEHHFGRVTAFFLYVGIIMLLERPIGRLPPCRWMSKNLPSPVIAHLLLLLHLPLLHWYLGDWIEGGYFKDFSISLWHVRTL